MRKKGRGALLCFFLTFCDSRSIKTKGTEFCVKALYKELGSPRTGLPRSGLSWSMLPRRLVQSKDWSKVDSTLLLLLEGLLAKRMRFWCANPFCSLVLRITGREMHLDISGHSLTWCLCTWCQTSSAHHFRVPRERPRSFGYTHCCTDRYPEGIF